MRGYGQRRWDVARDRALQRSGHRCERCGRKPPKVVLVVHHLDGKGMTGSGATRQTNLMVLCRSCHSHEHAPPGQR